MSEMIEETATVVRVEDGAAWVATKSRSACGHCGASGDCGTAMVAKLFGERENLLRLDNSLDAEVGERVVIGVSNNLLLKASALAYLLPLLFLIALVALGQMLGMGEGASTLLGFVGLGIGLWAVNHVTGGTRGHKDYCPLMLRRVGTVIGPIDFKPNEFKKGVVT